MRLLNVALIAGLLFLTVHVLVVAQAFLMPLVVAIGFWFLINMAARGLMAIPVVGPPFWLALLLSLIGFLVCGWLLGGMVANNFNALSLRLPEYQARLDALLESFAQSLDFEPAPTLSDLLGDVSMRGLASSVAASVAALASQAGLILIYILFLLVQQRFIPQKLAAMLSEHRAGDVRTIVARVGRDIRTYLGIKTATSLAVALLGYAVFSWIGLDFAAFWAVLVFCFNFIPTLGNLLSLLGPALTALVQFETLEPLIVVVLALGVPQVLISNLVEPAFMGRSLNLSPFVIMVSLVAFGTIWGIVGMFLAVPIMVIVMIVLAHFPRTRPFAVALSADGRLSTIP